MPTLFSKRRLRLPIDLGSFENFTDQLTGSTPQMWRGNDYRVEIGAFVDLQGAAPVDDDALADILGSGWESLTLEVKATAGTTDNLMAATVSAFNDGLTAETWNDLSTAHAVLEFSAAETNIAPGSYHLVISVITTGGASITLGTSQLTVREDGAHLTVDAPPVNPGDPMTLGQADARYAALDRLDELEGRVLLLPVDSGITRLFLSDTFTRADSALGGVGNGWLDLNTKWEVEANAVRGSTTGYNVDLLARPERHAEPKVTATVEYKDGGGSAGQSAAVWIRTTASAVNGYAAWLTDVAGDPVFALGKFTGGSPSTPSTLVVPSLALTGFYVITIQGLGGQIRATVASSASPTVILGTLTLNDTSYPTGQVALSPLVVNGLVNQISIEDRATAPLVICDGNSMTEGYLVAAADAYPAQLAALLGPGWTVINLGVSAQTTAAMLSDAGTQVDPLYRAGRRRNVVIAWEITNHLFFGATAENALAAYKSYCSERRAAGFRVIAVTVTPRSEVGTPVDWEAKRTVVNAALRDEAFLGVYWDAVYDVAADARFDDETDATYFSDLVHMTPAGYAIVAARLATIVGGEIAY